MKVLYLGNKFYAHKKVKSVMETLEPLFEDFCTIKTASDKKNQIVRFLDMFYYFLIYGLKSDKIIIDVYSTRAFYFALIISRLSKLFKKRYILFLHGGNLPYRYQKSPYLMSKMFNSAEHIIAPSHFLQAFFQDKGFAVSHIPNIIELIYYPFKQRTKLRPRILALRGFGKPYNPLMTLRAIKHIKDEIPNLNLLMLGNKSDYHFNDVQKYISENKLEKFVTLLPKCTRDEWVELSADYDIMISNPNIDNTPVSLVEGMALGMCLISTKVGGVPYLVKEDQVRLINSNDDKALAEEIRMLLDNPAIANQLSYLGRKKAEEFDWLKVKSMWVKILS